MVSFRKGSVMKGMNKKLKEVKIWTNNGSKKIFNYMTLNVTAVEDDFGPFTSMCKC